MSQKFPLGKIYKSNENLKTYLLPFNRPIDQKHVGNIAVSIAKHGWKGIVTFVYTNLYSKSWRLYIVDGQHRVLAATMAKTTYRYEVVECSTEEEIVVLMADLNNNSKSWYLQDYMNVWAAKGRKPYQYLQEIRKKTNLPLAPLIHMYGRKNYTSEVTGSATKPFKAGNFTLSNKSFADEVIKHLTDLRSIKGLRIRDTFMTAYVICYSKRKKFDAAGFKEKVKKKVKEFNKLGTVVDYKELIEKVYA